MQLHLRLVILTFLLLVRYDFPDLVIIPTTLELLLMPHGISESGSSTKTSVRCVYQDQIVVSGFFVCPYAFLHKNSTKSRSLQCSRHNCATHSCTHRKTVGDSSPYVIYKQLFSEP